LQSSGQVDHKQVREASWKGNLIGLESGTPAKKHLQKILDHRELRSWWIYTRIGEVKVEEQQFRFLPRTFMTQMYLQRQCSHPELKAC